MSNHPNRSRGAGRGDEPLELIGDVLRETERAFLFLYEGKEQWLPKKLCAWNADELTMTLPRWIAEKDGLVER